MMVTSGRRTAWRVAAGAVLVMLAMSCARRVTVPPVPTTPRYPDFAFPQLTENVGDDRARAQHQRAWQLLQIGDLRGAEREYSALVKRAPAFYPAETGLGYVLVALQKPKDALGRFDRVLQQRPLYASALAGKGEALLAMGERDLALDSFEAARTSDPTMTDLARRIDVLRFARVRELVAAATRAAESGRLEDARRSYATAIDASPESAFLYRDLGLVDNRLGDWEAATVHLRKAVELDPADVRALVALGEARERLGDLPGALEAYEGAYALDPSEATRKARDRVGERAELAKLPAEYRAIPALAQITRADLAALIGIRLRPFIASIRPGSAIVATDVRGHWATTWIMSVTRAGIMDVYVNHTFQPRAVVRRIDLAQVVSRALSVASVPAGRRPPASVAMADLSAGHLRYADAAAAVASGVMPLVDSGFFRPSRVVSGAEAADVVDRLGRLTNRGRAAGPAR